jgi:hypothetical protein
LISTSTRRRPKDFRQQFFDATQTSTDRFLTALLIKRSLPPLLVVKTLNRLFICSRKSKSHASLPREHRLTPSRFRTNAPSSRQVCSRLHLPQPHKLEYPRFLLAPEQWRPPHPRVVCSVTSMSTHPLPELLCSHPNSKPVVL